MLTPKQKEILVLIKRLGSSAGITAMDIGVYFDQPRKKSEKWAKPAIKELLKQKLVTRDGDMYRPVLDD